MWLQHKKTQQKTAQVFVFAWCNDYIKVFYVEYVKPNRPDAGNPSIEITEITVYRYSKLHLEIPNHSDLISGIPSITFWYKQNKNTKTTTT